MVNVPSQAEGFDPISAGRATGGKRRCRHGFFLIWNLLAQSFNSYTDCFTPFMLKLIEVEYFQGFDFDISDFCDQSERCCRTAWGNKKKSEDAETGTELSWIVILLLTRFFLNSQLVTRVGSKYETSWLDLE